MESLTKDFERPLFEHSKIYNEVTGLGTTFADVVGVNLGLVILTFVFRLACNRCCKESLDEDIDYQVVPKGTTVEVKQKDGQNVVQIKTEEPADLK